MNDLEERLRAAFDARASTFEASPHAWARVRDRRPRGRTAARLVLAALPVALLAVFVPVLLDGGLGRNTANDPDTIYQGLMRDRTAAGEQLTVDNPTEGRPLRLWFARARLGYPELCFVMERADAESYGGCTPVPNEPNTDAWFTGSTLRDGAETAMDWGVAVQGIGGVTGVAADGRTFSGTVLRPSGAPYRIWTVTYPARHAMSRIEIADDRGRSLGRRSRDPLMPPERSKAAGAALDLPAGVTARPHATKEGMEVSWTRHGAELSSTPAGALREPVDLRMEENVIMGLARADVARIEVAFDGGVTAGIETRPDPWGLGVALFAAEHPTGDRQARHDIVAYDAAGTQVWRQDDANRDRLEDTPPIGETMTLPGTEGPGGPVRVWFTSFGEDMLTLCQSGGVTPWGGTSCQGTSGGSLFPLKAIRYLPEPGSVTYVGAVHESWESVEAVLSDRRRIRAEILRGTGTPAPIWHVTIQTGDVVLGGFSVRKEDGRIERFPETDKGCGRKAVTTETGRQALPAGVTALVVEPSCMAFFENGEPSASLPGPLPGERLSDLLGPDRPLYWAHGAGTWYGYARAGTATIKLVTANGLTTTAEAVPDQWGQGVVLFAAPAPKGGDFSAGMVTTGYGADGEELWQDGPVTRRK
ncbi:hypothetical protein ACBJ59_40795 [Nonomuraea sp. MTCD27]|uniref:hypothetical protein n=1 Tax=Nonomuraea sp. MTCD27 TaxID=1676747 RepID=UPI0035C10A92